LGLCGDRLSVGFALGLACVATLVISPVARGHYFLLYVPALLFGGLWLRERYSEKQALWFALIPALLCSCHYLAMSVAGRMGLLGIGTSLWFFAACGVVVAHARWRLSCEIDTRSASAESNCDSALRRKRRCATSVPWS